MKNLNFITIVLLVHGIASASPPHHNQAPFAIDDFFSVTQDSVDNVLPVLENDYDPDGDNLVIVSISEVDEGGTVAINETKDGLVYTPDPGFIGTSNFTYTIEDDRPNAHKHWSSLTDTASVEVTVTTMTDPPGDSPDCPK